MLADNDSPRRLVALAAVLLVSTLAAACGPVQSTSRLGQAHVALERARVAEADRKAPYEYYSARFYLHKAEEEWGYSDFEASFDYATEAKRAAEAALLKAKEDPWTGSPVDDELTQDAMKDLGAESLDMSVEDKAPGGEGNIEMDVEDKAPKP